MKGKPLLPTLRNKKRYVVFEVISAQQILCKTALEKVRIAFKEYFGSIEYSMAGIMDMHIYNENRGILKINHKYVDHLRLAMSAVKTVEGVMAIIKTNKVSGMVNQVKKEVMGG